MSVFLSRLDVAVLCCDVVCVMNHSFLFFVFFFKQKTAYEMRISDWSSDVCSSDLGDERAPLVGKRESSRQAVEEAHAEPAFKLRDMMADGPLADAKLDRGAGESEVTRRSFEGAQGVRGKLGAGHDTSSIIILALLRNDALQKGGGIGERKRVGGGKNV